MFLSWFNKKETRDQQSYIKALEDTIKTMAEADVRKFRLVEYYRTQLLTYYNEVASLNRTVRKRNLTIIKLKERLKELKNVENISKQ